MPTHYINLIAAGIVLAAAVLFAGVLLWYNRGPSTPTVPPSVVVTDALGESSSIPHYPNGGVDGRITAKDGQTLTVAVIPPGLVEVPSSAVVVSVVLDEDTDIYTGGGPKAQSVFQKELEAYTAQREPGELPPDPFIHKQLTVADLSVGTRINVVPKAGSAAGTTFHAKTIVPFVDVPAPLPAE